MSYDDATDDALMLATAEGSREAYDVLVRRHYPRLCAVAARYLGSPQLARDVTHDTLVDVLLGAKKYDPRGKFRAYVFRILLNHCRGIHRRRGYDDRMQVQLATAANDPEAPEDSAEAAQVREKMNKAVQKLGPKLQDVVHLRFAADLTGPEIAETLEISVGTVQSRLFNALKKLRDVIE